MSPVWLHPLEPLAEELLLSLILGGAALQRCGKCIVLNPALQAAEKLKVRIRVSL
jgi:hypothetical protein